MKRVAIIGAGPAGMTAAYQLSKEIGKTISAVDVFEASDRVGGMSASLSLWNQTVDLGPHRFFTYDKKVNSLWLEVAGTHYAPVSRLTRIYYRNKFYHYPLKAFNALFTLGLFPSLSAFFSYLKQKIRPEKDISTFEGWVTRRFGKRLYETFFKTYSEKLWGIPCTELDADFASQRIKKLSLGAAIWNSLFPGKSQRHKTLADEFLYPLGGTGYIYEEMARRAKAAGVKIYYGHRIKSVHVKDKRVIGLSDANGEMRHYDAVVSSMPVTDLISNMDGVPEVIRQASSGLRFRNTILVYLNIQHSQLFPDQWMYVHSKELQTGRITNFRNWVPELYGSESSSILAMEYWCFDEDELWNMADDKLIELATREVQKSGLSQNAAVTGGKVIRLHRSYPVYFSGYRQKLAPVEEFLSEISHLYPIGRYGAYKYNNQDHSLLMGMLAAENIAFDKRNSLWEVNTDYDSYQEGENQGCDS